MHECPLCHSLTLLSNSVVIHAGRLSEHQHVICWACAEKVVLAVRATYDEIELAEFKRKQQLDKK